MFCDSCAPKDAIEVTVLRLPLVLLLLPLMLLLMLLLKLLLMLLLKLLLLMLLLMLLLKLLLLFSRSKSARHVCLPAMASQGGGQ
eukprot:COSAG06_NODE_10536_length_1663_cov_1580.142583_2_plen_85_part_00